MFLKRLVLLGVILGAGVGTAACTDGYGYSGVAVGYGSGGYYGDGYGYADPYYGGGYDGYSSYFGWYGDYYYPGTGIYVYDQYRRPYRWNDTQRRYWEGRRNSYRGDRNYRNDWNGFDRNRGDGYRGGPGAGGQGYRDRGNRTPAYQGGGRPDRGNWRQNRQNFSGNTGAITPQSTQQATTQGAAPQRSFGGDRGYRGGGDRSGGNRGWRGRR